MNEALVLLVLVWAALLVPSALRSRNASPHATVGGFEHAMDVLRSESHGPSGGREVFVPGDAGRIVERPLAEEPPPADAPVPRGEDPIIARRRAWFVRSLAATAVTLVLGIVVGGWLWLPFALTCSFTVVYIAVLRRLKLQRDEARKVVRELDLGAEVETRRERPAVGDEAWHTGTVRLRRWDD